jgi:nucleoside-diphosphate-sugar epimerase
MKKLNPIFDEACILVTGVAGFIGGALALRLLSDFDHVQVVGIDSLTDYYDVRLKHHRLEQLRAFGNRFVFVHDSIAN